MSDIQLLIDGVVHEGWTQASVSRSLESLADTFSLAITEPMTAAPDQRKILLGDAAAIRVAGETIVTGYIDRIQPSYSGRDHTVTVSGRSKTGDLVDCAVPAGAKTEFKNRTLLEVATQLAEPFGITVDDQVGLKTRKTRRLEPGQTIHEYLTEQARIEAVRFVSMPDGSLAISRAGSGEIQSALVLGENIRAASAEFDMASRFSDYYVIGQQSGGFDSDASSAAHIKGHAKVDGIRYRPTVIHAEGSVDLAGARERADWQRAVSYGRSRRVTYTVAGWRHTEGLWAPNVMVPISDDYLNINEKWLLVAVSFTSDSRGTSSELTLMPRQAMDLISLPPKEKESGWGS